MTRHNWITSEVKRLLGVCGGHEIYQHTFIIPCGSGREFKEHLLIEGARTLIQYPWQARWSDLEALDFAELLIRSLYKGPHRDALDGAIINALFCSSDNSTCQCHS